MWSCFKSSTFLRLINIKWEKLWALALCFREGQHFRGDRRAVFAALMWQISLNIFLSIPSASKDHSCSVAASLFKALLIPVYLCSSLGRSSYIYERAAWFPILKRFYCSIRVYPAHLRGMFKQQMDERSQHVYAISNIAGSTFWEAVKNVTFLRKHGVQTF